MSIKLIALDIDGTLTSGFRHVGEENRSAICEAQQAGVFVTLATGRGYLGSRPIWEALNVQGPVINYGGALITDTVSERLIRQHTLDAKTVSDALLFAKAQGVHIQLYQGDTVITEVEDGFVRRYTERLNLPKRIDPDIARRTWENVPKMLAYVDPGIEDEMRARFSRHLSGRAGVSKTEPGFIEINSESATKGQALSDLAGILGVQREEVAAIGDSYLDMSMIAWAGDGVCVENGLDAVKEIADRMIPSCDENGVAYYIKHYVL